MFNNPFREEAAASKNERQQLDHLLRITAPHERVILAAIGVVLVGFVAWSLLGSIVRAVTLDGVLIEPGIRHEVVSTEPGHLVEVLVTAGDRVAAGAPIARQTVPELEREAAVLLERVGLLEAELRDAGGQNDALRSLLDTTDSALLQMESRRDSRASIVSHGAGEVMKLFAAPGDYLPAGAAVALLRAMDDGPRWAVLQVTPDMAQRIETGMKAEVEVAAPDGTLHRLEGEVAVVASEPIPDWLAALLPASSGPAHRVEVVLHDASDLSVPDGTPCRIRIELGRDTPVALLAAGPS